MAHFAKLGLNLKVIDVVVVGNSVIKDSDGNESEKLGIDFLNKTYSYPFWKQTSYNENFRKNFAGIGMTYDDDKDAFIPKQPYPSWTLNETTCKWEAPVEYPSDADRPYTWDEDTENWV